MSIKVIKGSLDTLALLRFLSPDTYITSSLIRERFSEIKPGTLRKKLETLVNQKVVEKLKKTGERAGDDRTEYKLTAKGEKVRAELVDYASKILNLSNDKT
ncbi:MAG: hypothetical protein ACFFFT_00015 [Candidatus Thorarchaeota archaeon]